MIAFEAGLLGVGTLLVFSPRFGAHHEHHGVLMGTAAGILFGVSDVAIKAITAGRRRATSASSRPGSLTCIAASVLAFYASARGLQQGEAVPVITLTSAAANVSAITGGFVVFGDPMPGDALGIVIQASAFIMVIVAAALTPAPQRTLRSRSSDAQRALA